MASPSSPSPTPPQASQPSALLPSSIFSTPSFSSTLPLQRPLSASDAFRRGPRSSRARHPSQNPRRNARSAATSRSASSDGSLGDFSMENYTVDLARMSQGDQDSKATKEDQGPGRASLEQDIRKSPDVGNENDDDDDGSDGSDILGDYTVDLGALGDKPSSIVVNDGELERDELPSDDEGPEDFTMNMEKWMRGGEKWKTAKDVNDQDGEEADDEGSAPGENEPDVGKEDGEERHSKEDEEAEAPEPQHQDPAGTDENHAGGIDEESLFEPSNSSTPASQKYAAPDIQGPTSELESRPQLPKRTNTELQERAAEEVFDRISALQAEVERMREEEEARRAEQDHWLRDNELLREEVAKLKRDNEDARQQRVKEVEAQRREMGKELAASNLENREAQANEQRAQHLVDQLRSQLTASKVEEGKLLSKLELIKQRYFDEIDRLKRDIGQEQQSAKNERNKCLTLAREAADLAEDRQQTDARRPAEEALQNQDIASMRSELEQLRQGQSSKLDGMKNELQKERDDHERERQKSFIIAEEAAKLAESKQLDERTIQELKDEEEARRTELEHAHNELREARRIVDEVEDENDRLSQELEASADCLVEARGQLQAKITELKASPATMTELRASEEAKDVDSAQDRHTAVVVQLNEDHQSTISAQKAKHKKDIEVLSSALQKASKARLKSEQDLKQSHESQTSKLQDRISTLESQLSEYEDVASTHSAEDELRSAIRVLNNKLSKSHDATRSARAEAQEARNDVESVAETNKAVNAELERRFADAVEKREAEWLRRINLLFREREKMGKALMLGWGREEMGKAKEGERQAYRYKYVKGRF